MLHQNTLPPIQYAQSSATDDIGSLSTPDKPQQYAHSVYSESQDAASTYSQPQDFAMARTFQATVQTQPPTPLALSSSPEDYFAQPQPSSSYAGRDQYPYGTGPMKIDKLVSGPSSHHPHIQQQPSVYPITNDISSGWVAVNPGRTQNPGQQGYDDQWKPPDPSNGWWATNTQDLNDVESLHS